MTSDVTLQLSPITGYENADDWAAKLAIGFDGDRAPPRNLLAQTQSMLRRDPRPEPWGAYLAWSEETPVGTCAFKSSPNPNGAVEIAYMTFPAFEGRGYASAMVDALVAAAFRAGAEAVIAHTLPEENPSNRALKRNGFSWDGEVVDSEDGPVWRWSKRR